MPHFVLEYTDNIKREARVPELLRKVNAVLMAQSGVFPTGGIRARAIELKDYCIADGEGDYAFVHAHLKIGAGRTEEVKKKVCDELFAMMEDHFADLFSRRYMALSLELTETREGGAYKHNNLHPLFQKAPG